MFRGRTRGPARRIALTPGVSSVTCEGTVLVTYMSTTITEHVKSKTPTSVTPAVASPPNAGPTRPGPTLNARQQRPAPPREQVEEADVLV